MTPASAQSPLRIIRNFLVLSGGELVSKILTLLTFAFIARVTGPIGFGYLEFASSIALCAVLIVDQGFGVYGAREIAREPDATPRLVAEVAWLRFGLACVAYLCLYVFVSLLDRPALSQQLVILYGLAVFFTPLMLQWVFQGHDRMQAVAGMQILRQGTFALVVFALLRKGNELWPVAAAELAGAGVVVVASLWLYRQHFERRIPLKPAFSWRVIREGSTIGLGQILWALRMYGATILVGLIATEQDVGFFGASMRLAIGFNTFVWLYFFNLFPSLARTWSSSPAAFQQLMARSIRIAGWSSLAGGLLWVLLAPLAVRWAYGSAFVPATSTLQWMCGICVLGAIHGNFRFGLIAASHERYATLSAAVGTAVALALIPFAYARLGIDGAAAALIVGEAAVWIASYVFSRRLLRPDRPLIGLLRPLAAGVSIVLALWALPTQTSLLVRLSIAVAGLGAAVWASEAEIRTWATSRLRSWLRAESS